MISNEDFENWKKEEFEVFEKLQQNLRKVASELPESVASLTNIGWYYFETLSPGEVIGLSHKIDSQIIMINDFMSKRLADNLNSIKKLIKGQHPERWHIISQAFKAHENGQFDLSIPIFLIQADGIIIKSTGYSVFTSEKISGQHYPKTSKIETGDLINGIAWMLMHPLRMKTEVNHYSTISNQRILNRHSIIHGESLNYGTELNSLKAISFLYCIVKCVKRLNTKTGQ